MLKFSLIFPLILVGFAVLAYFAFFGNGDFYLPGLEVIDSGKRIVSSKIRKEVDPGPITLNQIFVSDHKNIAKLSAQKLRIVIATGDVIPARSVNYQTVSRKDFKWPYLKTADFLNKGDITFINLETPLISKCPVTQEGMIFCGDKRNVEGLTFAGVDVASLANNHSANHGKEGIDETVKLLASSGILTTGVNDNLAIKEIRGLKFAFLGYSDIEKTPLVSTAEEEKIKREVSEAKQKADVVIVTFHWGKEYVTAPDDRQKQLGRLAIDSGADLVIGNHPHWIKPLEIYNGKLITYAHGNFVFDQEWSQKTKEGVVGKYTFYNKQLIDVEFFPVGIVDFGQPYFLEGERKKKILDGLYQSSLDLLR